MATEGTLKTKWIRNIRKQGFIAKSMSPHQIPGLPDILVLDRGVTPVVQETHRGRCWWLEAKKCNPGPFAFKAERDATPAQTKWVLTWDTLGQPSGWLVLDDQRWMFAPSTQLVVTREEFTKKAIVYSSEYRMLRDEIEPRRAPLIRDTDKRVDSIEKQILRMYGKK